MSPRARVTGFGPFGAVADNPSGAVASSLAARLASRGWDADAETLRVTFDEALAAPARLVAPAPTLLVHVGVAEARRSVSLERAARNLAGARPDVDGRVAAGPLERGGPPLRRTSLDVDALAASARAPVPVEASDDCGDYVCNAIYWRALALVASRAARCALFVHVPMMSRELAHAVGAALADALERTDGAWGPWRG